MQSKSNNINRGSFRKIVGLCVLLMLVTSALTGVFVNLSSGVFNQMGVDEWQGVHQGSVPDSTDNTYSILNYTHIERVTYLRYNSSAVTLEFNGTVLANDDYYLYKPFYKRIWNATGSVYEYNVSWVRDENCSVINGPSSFNEQTVLDRAGLWIVLPKLLPGANSLDRVNMSNMSYFDSGWKNITGWFWVNSTNWHVGVNSQTITYDTNQTLVVSVYSDAAKTQSVNDYIWVDMWYMDNTSSINTSGASMINHHLLSPGDGGNWIISGSNLYNYTHNYGSGLYHFVAYADYEGSNNTYLDKIYGSSDEGYGSGAGYNNTFGHPGIWSNFSGTVRDSYGRAITINYIGKEATYNYTTCGPFDPPEYMSGHINISVNTGTPSFQLINSSMVWNSSSGEVKIIVKNQDGTRLNFFDQSDIVLYNRSNSPGNPGSLPIDKDYYNLTVVDNSIIKITPNASGTNGNKWGYNQSTGYVWADYMQDANTGDIYVVFAKDKYGDETEELNGTETFAVIASSLVGGDYIIDSWQASSSPTYAYRNVSTKVNFSLPRMTGMNNMSLDNLTIYLPSGITYNGNNGTSLGYPSQFSVTNTTTSVTWKSTGSDGFTFNSTEYFWFDILSNASFGSSSFTIKADRHTGGNQTFTITFYTTRNFSYSGTVYNRDGSPISGAVASLAVQAFGQMSSTTLGTFSATTNSTGEFNITNVPVCINYSAIDCSQVSMGPGASGTLFYQLTAYDYNDSSNTTAINVSRNLPTLPASMLKCMLNNPELYLIPAISFNVTAIGPQYNYQSWPPTFSGYLAKSFELFVKDQKLGYGVKEYTESASRRIFSVPSGRNYTLSLFPTESFPLSVRLNDIVDTCANANTKYNIFDITGVNTSCTLYNGTYLINVSVNTTSTMRNLSGYFQAITNPTSMRIVVYNMETESMVFENWAMPFNLGYEAGWSQYNDTYDLSTGEYNITIPATEAPSYLMLRAFATNGSGYYMGSAMINTSGGDINVANQTLNFTMLKLINGTSTPITANNVSNNWGQETIVNTQTVLFRLVNESGSLLSTESPFVDVTRTLNGTEYMTMIDGSNGVFNLSIAEGSSLKKLTIYSQSYASISTYVSSSILDGSTINEFFNCTNGTCNVTMRSFGGFDPLNESQDFSMSMYKSNDTCNVPNPPSGCTLCAAQSESEFSPLNAILKGDVSLMISSGNVSIYYANVDLLASGPPDAAFTDSGDEEEDGMAALWKFGSQGPEIYDFVIIGVNYSNNPGLVNRSINISFPYLYDAEFNVVWNKSQGHDLNQIRNWENLSDYRDYLNTSYEAFLNGTGVTASTTDNTLSSARAYNDQTNQTLYVRIPHFSGLNANTSGLPYLNITLSAATVTESNSFTVTVKQNNQTAVQGATVTFNSANYATDSNGQASISAPSVSSNTAYQITATKTGYTDAHPATITVQNSASNNNNNNPGGGGAPSLPTSAPTADTGGPYTGYIGQTITFDSSDSTDPDEDTLQYRWDWNNDGSYETEYSTTATATHSWNAAGNYTIKLKVKDTSDLTDTATTYVLITEQTEPDTTNPTIESVSHMPTKITNNDTVTITATITDDIAIAEVNIIYKDGAEKTVSMSLSTTDVYTAIIGPFTAGKTITYSVQAKDTSDNTATSNTYTFSIKAEKTLGNITRGQKQNITSDEIKETGIENIELNAKTDLNDVKITIEKLGNTKPGNIAEEPKKTDITVVVGENQEVKNIHLYGYLEINLTANNTNVDEENIDSMKIKFKVELTWLTQNNIQKQDVKLIRYKDNKWTELTTTYLSEDETYAYFEADTPGTSTFAIVGGEVTDVQDTTTTGENTESEGELPVLFIILGIVGIIVLIILIMFKTGYIYIESTDETSKKEESKKKTDETSKTKNKNTSKKKK